MQQAMYFRKKERMIEPWDWVLIIGVTLSPMNYLRIWKVGPGELLCLLWGVKYLRNILFQSVNSYLTRFWLLFLLVISIGTAYGKIFYPKETIVSGLLTWLYFFLMSEGVYVGMREKRPDQIRQILYWMSVVVSCWYMFLYVYSLTINRFFFGIRLWFAGVRFSGGGNNPHLMATLIAVVMFFNVYELFEPGTPLWKRILSASCIVFCFIISKATKSSTLLVAIIITVLAFLFYKIMKMFTVKRDKWIAFSIIVIISTLFLGLFWGKLVDGITEWINEDANGAGRLQIFKSISITLKKNWLVGLGPGIHGLDGYIEYHNSYLEVLAMGGIIGFGIFAMFTYRLFQSLSVQPGMMFALIPIYAYSLAGFSMRRLCFWVVAATLIAYCEILQNEKAAQKSPELKQSPDKRSAQRSL